MGEGEATVTALEQRLRRVEDAQAVQATSILTQQLRLEEMEDCSRRNKLQLQGFPEATGTEDLAATALAIFRNIAGDTLPPNVSFDRIHRALGPRSAYPNHPRDVICTVHQYTHKEIILRRAWEERDTEFDGAIIQILTVLSRATLQWRAMLKPVLGSRSAFRNYLQMLPHSSDFRETVTVFHPTLTVRSPCTILLF